MYIFYDIYIYFGKKENKGLEYLIDGKFYFMEVIMSMFLF